MSQDKTIWETLLYVRDEASLQAHLMSMELKDEWQALEKRFQTLEQKFESRLLDKARQVGQKEETFFVGDREAIETLVKDFKDLHQKNDNQTR